MLPLCTSSLPAQLRQIDQRSMCGGRRTTGWNFSHFHSSLTDQMMMMMMMMMGFDSQVPASLQGIEENFSSSSVFEAVESGVSYVFFIWNDTDVNVGSVGL